MAGDLETEQETEGGPVKSFLEHLEDFRWVLIKSIVALGLGMLICLFGANIVVAILKWPMNHNPVRSFAQVLKIPLPYSSLYHHSGNQTAFVTFGTNKLGN